MMSIEPGELVVKSSEWDQLSDERDRYRAALERIAKGIYGREKEGDDPMITDWQIARAALKGDAG